MSKIVTREELESKCEWKKWVSRTSPPLWRSLEDLGYSRDNLLKKNGLDMFISWKKELHQLYANPTEHAKVFKMISDKARADHSIFAEHSDKCYAYCADYLSFCKAHDSYSGFSDSELKKTFIAYVDKNNAMVAYRPLVTMLDKLNQTFLEEELSKEGSSVFQIELIAPTKALPFVEERDDAIAIGKEIKALGLNIDSVLPESIEEHINRHIDKFGWLFTHHFLGEPMTRDDVLISVQKMQDGSYDPVKKAEENAMRISQLNNIKSINANIARHIEIAEDYAYMRSYRIDVANEADFYFRPCFMEIASRMGISYNDFLNLAVSEIISWFENPAEIESLKVKIEKRKEYFVTYLVDDNKSYIFEGKENFIPEEAKERPENLILSGKVAQKGRITGKVKIVYYKEEIEKVKDGDILVSPMTTPEMMIAIMKCAGIVTDEGGVACHAAQISREFNIPCIIATGEASLLLKDGDMVEIIADGIEGTVNLI